MGEIEGIPDELINKPIVVENDLGRIQEIIEEILEEYS